MRLITEIGDRLLALLAPKQEVHANRYYCAWTHKGCDFVCSNGFRLGGREHYCCYDDYTGQEMGCYDQRINCNSCQ